MSSSDTRAILEILGWMSTGVHVLLALAFVVVCFVRAKRIGMAGAILLAVIAFVDLGQVCVWRVGSLALRTTHASYKSVDGFFTAAGVMNVLGSLVSIGLAFAAYALLRKRPGA